MEKSLKSLFNTGPRSLLEKQDEVVPNGNRMLQSGRFFDNLDEWLDSAEASAYLRISPGALRNMVWRGEIRCYKLGRRNRYFKTELRNLLLQNKNEGFQ